MNWSAHRTKPYSKCYPFYDQQQSHYHPPLLIHRYSSNNSKQHLNNNRNNIIIIIIIRSYSNRQQPLFLRHLILHRVVLMKVILLLLMWIFFRQRFLRRIVSKRKCKILIQSRCTKKQNIHNIKTNSSSFFLFLIVDVVFFIVVIFLYLLSQRVSPLSISLSNSIWRMMMTNKNLKEKKTIFIYSRTNSLCLFFHMKFCFRSIFLSPFNRKKRFFCAISFLLSDSFIRSTSSLSFHLVRCFSLLFVCTSSPFLFLFFVLFCYSYDYYYFVSCL